MEETNGPINSLRSELSAQFVNLNVRIGTLENELHRHQDDDREDFRIVRNEIADVRSAFDRVAGGIEFSKWALGLGLPAIIGLLLSLLITKH
jgi:hypothetical protein